MSDSKAKSFSVKELEIETPKYPLAESPLLIDEFMIVGYTESLGTEKIIKPIIEEINSIKNYEEFYNLTEKKNKYLPTNLSTIVSEIKITTLKTENIIEYAFSVPPKIFYCIEKNNQKIKEPDDINFIFENIFSDTNVEAVNIGYSYGFYQKQLIELNNGINLYIFIPKFFIIISQYSYFYAFHHICKYIKEQFLNPNNEIPLEIQIYNIVNFLPCPLNNKIEFKLFTKNDFNYKSLNEYLNFANKDKNNTIYLDKLGAFKHTEINMGKIFEILSPEIIIQILFIILTGGKIAFFHEDLEILDYIMYFFFQITFPITPIELILCKSPNLYYYSTEFAVMNVVGFPCNFEKIKQFNPIKKDILYPEKFLIYEDSIKRDKYSEKLNKFEIIDLNNGNIKFWSLEDENNCNDESEEDENAQKECKNPTYSKDEQIRVDIYNHLLSLFKNPDINLNIELNQIIFELYNSLVSLSNIIKEKKYFSYFIENDDIKKYSLSIQEVFLKFLVLFCNNYFKISKNLNKNKVQDPQEQNDNKSNEIKLISEIEEKVFSQFKITSYGDILKDFDEHKVKTQSATRKIFDNLMQICKTNDMNKKLLNGLFIEFLDSIFFDKKKENEEIITFYEFFKYYNEKMKKKIFNWANDDIFDKRKIVKENEIFYYYRYKSINLSNDLILKYNLYLSELDGNIKNKIFPKKVKMKNSLNSKNINNIVDEFLISKAIYNTQNLLQFCILSTVILSIPELKLVSFAEPIYNLFSKMNFQIVKYVELILNISYRYFLNKEDIGAKEELIQYINIYKKAIEENNLNKCEELALLKNKIELLIKQKKEGNNLIPKEIIKKILDTPEESLFILIPDKLESNDYEDILKEGKINKKISIKGDLLKNKEISEEFIYYPNTLFRKFDELIYSFYNDLDIEKIRDKYYKLILNTMFYIRLTKDNFPHNTLKFLFYCLIKEK